MLFAVDLVSPIKNLIEIPAADVFIHVSGTTNIKHVFETNSIPFTKDATWHGLLSNQPIR